MIKFDQRKSPFFEVDCPPFGIQEVYIDYEVYKPYLKRTKRFLFFGDTIKMEFQNRLIKSELKKAEKEIECVSPVWEKIWRPSLDRVNDLRDQEDRECLDPDETQIWISTVDHCSTMGYVLGLYGDGRWDVELDREFNIVDVKIAW